MDKRVTRGRSQHRRTYSSLLLAATLVVAGGSDDDDDNAGPAEPTAPGTSEEVDPFNGLDGTVVVNTSGGSLNDVFREVWWDPFTDESGVAVTDTSPVQLAVVQQQVTSGNVEFDLVSLETGGDYLRAVEEDLLEPLDIDRIRSIFEAKGGDWADIPEESIDTHGVWFGPFATMLMFDEREFPDSGPQPDSLDDLWNFEEFPGRRCMPNYAQFSLEIALHADGVSSDEMYPLDVDRALAKLDELKPHLATLWSGGAEPVQLVADGECVMSAVWNGRPYAAATEDGLDYLGVAWDGGIFHRSWLVVPKGASNPEAAHALIATWLTTDVGAAVAERIVYGNANERTADFATDEVRSYMATTPENYEVMTVQDDQWWLDNGADAEAKFAQWAAR